MKSKPFCDEGTSFTVVPRFINASLAANNVSSVSSFIDWPVTIFNISFSTHGLICFNNSEIKIYSIFLMVNPKPLLSRAVSLRISLSVSWSASLNEFRIPNWKVVTLRTYIFCVAHVRKSAWLWLYIHLSLLFVCFSLKKYVEKCSRRKFKVGCVSSMVWISHGAV